MKRASFVQGLSAAVATARLRSPHGAPDLVTRLEAIIADFPARVAVFIQRVFDRYPLVSIRADESFPAASLIKLAIMLAVYRAIARKKLTLNSEVRIGENDVVAGSDSFGSARAGSEALVSRLLEAMIQQSDNTAGNALIGRLGFADINAVIAQYGLRATSLQRYFMHFSTIHDNVTTARDVGAMLLRIARAARGTGQGFDSRAAYRSMIDLLLGQEDRETLAAGLPKRVPLADKTGELPTVRHDAGIVDPYGPRPYVVVVLERKLTSQYLAVLEMRRISHAIYDRLE